MARAKGKRTRGYWYIKRLKYWVASEGKSAIPLLDEQGNRIRCPDDAEGAKLAYARYLLDRQKRESLAEEQQATGAHMPMMEVCRRYLAYCQKHGAEATFTLRAGILFDFCQGFPAEFKNATDKPPESERIHKGYARTAVGKLTKQDVRDWIEAHPRWKTGRAQIQALRRAICFCIDEGLIPANPIRGVKVEQPGKRVTYFTDEQEKAIYEHASPEFALAIYVCIRTGARNGEFAHLEKRHVYEMDNGEQRWIIPKGEAKVKTKDRVIFVPDDVAEIVRERLAKQPKGKVFRNTEGNRWTPAAWKSAFKRLRDTLAENGTALDDDAVMYTARHTFAKRMLGGYWGPPVTLEVLAGLMGNTPKICYQHYAQWASQYTDPLRGAVNHAPKTSPARKSGL